MSKSINQLSHQVIAAGIETEHFTRPLIRAVFFLLRPGLRAPVWTEECLTTIQTPPERTSDMYLGGVVRAAGGCHGFLVVVRREVEVRDLREEYFEEPDVKPHVVLAVSLR